MLNFIYQHEGICIQNYSIQSYNMFMIYGMHDCCLFQELDRIVLHALTTQALDSYLDLQIKKRCHINVTAPK